MSRQGFSARDYKLVSSFETIRETLLEERYRDRLSKPLAYWVLPNDRRLPLKFLDRSIGDLVQTPFEELSATPGIGQKKISSLVKLLMRAANDEPPTVPFGLSELSESNGVHYRLDQGSEFNASLVSEALWSEWTTIVRKFQLGDEALGRVAESLASMPTVIWTKKLGEYENLTLSQIRGLRTHGEKRVRCVMRVFHRVHSLAKAHGLEGNEALRRKLGSKRILDVSSWITNHLTSDRLPSVEEVRTHLAEPILQQIEVDCGEAVYRIALQRLGLDAAPMSVREQAQAMGVTRARVYQLLDDCHKVIDVRWTKGRDLLDRMTAKYGSYLGVEQIDATLFLAVRQLCFPDRNESDHKDEFTGSPHFLPSQQASNLS